MSFDTKQEYIFVNALAMQTGACRQRKHRNVGWRWCSSGAVTCEAQGPQTGGNEASNECDSAASLTAHGARPIHELHNNLGPYRPPQNLCAMTGNLSAC